MCRIVYFGCWQPSINTICDICNLYNTVYGTETLTFLAFVSSPEPKDPAELNGWEGSVVRRHHPTLSNDFSTEPVLTKFHTWLPRYGVSKSYSNGPGHMTNMAAMPIMVKTSKSLRLQNQFTYDLETWYVTSGIRVIPRLFKS